MTGYRDEALIFPCADEALVGILSRPSAEADSASIGVLVVVGGPQYRVGSHRQFTLLSRSLAEAGVPCLRFDYRGMGDASGPMRSFEDVSADIRAAVDTFLTRCPHLKGVVLWGLCDGASASAFYAPTDKRICGLVLLNPWVRTEQGGAEVLLKHYYLKRLMSRSFWKKVLSGKFRFLQSATDLKSVVDSSRQTTHAAAVQSLPERVRAGLAEAGVPMLIVLSGNDFVAQEFERVTRVTPGWSELLFNGVVERLPDADHTFSSARHRDAVARVTVDWLESLDHVRQ